MYYVLWIDEVEMIVVRPWVKDKVVAKSVNYQINEVR